MIVNLIESIVKRLVEQPDKVDVREIEAQGKQVVKVLVVTQDLSRVIGSEGRTFRALRTLVGLLADRRDLVVDTFEI